MLSEVIWAITTMAMTGSWNLSTQYLLGLGYEQARIWPGYNHAPPIFLGMVNIPTICGDDSGMVQMALLYQLCTHDCAQVHVAVGLFPVKTMDQDGPSGHQPFVQRDHGKWSPLMMGDDDLA